MIVGKLASLEKKTEASEVAKWIKISAAKTVAQSLIPLETHMIQGENQQPHVVL